MTRLAGFDLFGSEAPVLRSLAREIIAEPSFAGISPVATYDRDQLRRSLHAAWGTEVLLGLTGQYAREDLIALGNSWGAVQAYYACYHATQALIVARGQPRPTSHPKTQRMYVDLWVMPPRPFRLWSLGAEDGGYRNLPASKMIDETIHPWATTDASTCWDVSSKAMRTTRDDAVAEALSRRRDAKRRARRTAWTTEEAARLAAGRKPRKQPDFPRPRLTPAERSTVEGGVRPYGFLDYMYRLRIKAQYEDATMFTEGPDSESDSVLVYRDLRRLTSTTLLLHELHVRETIGRSLFEPLVNEWLTASGSPVNPLADRRGLLFP